MKKTEYWITTQNPYKEQKIAVRGIRDHDQAIKLAREMHMTRPAAQIEILKVERLVTLRRTRR